MKVGTDGLLLGAWAQGGSSVLDIGTGTGLIALMMAQRFPEAHVDAIDIDADAASQAEDNARRSPFADRVAVRCVSLQEYVAEMEYDSIVCNPPFFAQSLQSPDSKRTLARHSIALPFDDLFRHARRLMSEDGVLSIVVPSDALSQIETAAVMNNLFLVRRCLVRTTRKKPARRLLLSFSQKPSPFHDEEGVIQEVVNEPSEWYRNLTCDFLLKY
jgi:tRNA1Val (adenine37-N6)-methyltransferase